MDDDTALDLEFDLTGPAPKESVDEIVEQQIESYIVDSSKEN